MMVMMMIAFFVGEQTSNLSLSLMLVILLDLFLIEISLKVNSCPMILTNNEEKRKANEVTLGFKLGGNFQMDKLVLR